MMSCLALSFGALSSFAVAKPGEEESKWRVGGRNQPPILKEEAVKKALAQFDSVKEEITKTYESASELPEYLRIVAEAKTNFSRHADSYLPEMPYRPYEFRVMSGLVAITITGLQQEIALRNEAATTGMSAAVEKRKRKEVKQRTAADMVSLVVENGAAPAQPNADVSSGVDATGGTGRIGAGVGAAQTGLNNDRRPGRWNGGWYEGDEDGRRRWEKRVGENSAIVILGVQSTNCAMDPAKCDPPKPFPTPRPPETPTTPDNTSPSWPSNESVINDISKTIGTTGATNVMTSQGMSALQRGDYGRALALAQAALRDDPRNRGALEIMYSVKGRDAAIATADTGADALGRSAAGGFVDGGGFASVSPQVSAAVSEAARVAGDQARADAMNALKLGDAQSALGILSKALTRNLDNPALLNLRAQTYGRLGRWEEALKDAVSGLALAPGNMILLNTKALCENRTRRWRDARATAERVITLDPRNAWAYANRAHAWGGLGDRDAMLADINRAAALDARFRRTAVDAALLQIPSDSDVVFLFPGESAKGASKAPVADGRAKSFSVLVGAAIFGGLLLALGLMSTVLASLKDTVISAFTRAKRAAPATNPALATAQPASVAGDVGGLIRGQYEILRQIGAGGMGLVYEGTDRSLGRRVAIKKMRDELRLNPRERERFIIEAKTVASLHHPNIVDIYAIAEEGEDIYLVFEYMDGKTVHDLVQLKGRLDSTQSVRVTRAMGEALTYAHAHGVIHRDMKPSNVMLTSAGQIKVMDFGIARMAKDAATRYSMTNTVVGTPPYMAPEQEQGVVRKESDVYSLAICAYEMLTGKLPFIGISAGMLMNKINMSYVPPSRNIAGLPDALDEVFLKAFQADPDRRYRTPQEFVAALSAAVDGVRGPRSAEL